MNATSGTQRNSAVGVRRRVAGLSRSFHPQSSQSVIEMAFLIPILLLLVIGIIEIGRYAYLSILVANAAEAGAEYGSQGLNQSADASGIQNAALNDGQNLSGLTVTSSTACGCDSGGTTTASPCSGSSAGTCGSSGHWIVTVQVSATGTFHSLFNYPGIPQSLATTRAVTMRVKQ